MIQPLAYQGRLGDSICCLLQAEGRVFVAHQEDIGGHAGVPRSVPRMKSNIPRGNWPVKRMANQATIQTSKAAIPRGHQHGIVG